jgi:phage terminase small subunit
LQQARAVKAGAGLPLEDCCMALAAKQQRCVAQYLIDLNATQVAIQSGCSGETAAEQASRLLSNVNV